MKTEKVTVCGVTKLKKVFVILLICLLALIVCSYEYFGCSLSHNVFINEHESKLIDRDSIGVHDYFEKRKLWMTSNLGSILFKDNDDQYYTRKNKTFTILIWKYWNWLKNRHLNNHLGKDPLDTCSVKNCVVTGDEKDIRTADVVVIHVQHGTIPSLSERHPAQRWVFLSDESPVNSFSMARKKPNLTSWANVFNWSMTYRSDADVPVPYGRTVPLPVSFSPNEPLANLIPNWELKENKVLASALISHCGVSARMNYIKELKTHIDVDVYGICSEKNLTCPGHFKEDCPVINKYLFYLAFENTKCRQYLTEKIFYNAYSKGAIPVILGAPKEDCDILLPPSSFLHVDNYQDPKDLAEDMRRIAMKEESLLKFHEWRRHYDLLNEHGFFKTKSFHICRLCEALNFNDPSPKVYSENDLKLFFDPKLTCKVPSK